MTRYEALDNCAFALTFDEIEFVTLPESSPGGGGGPHNQAQDIKRLLASGEVCSRAFRLEVGDDELLALDEYLKGPVMRLRINGAFEMWMWET